MPISQYQSGAVRAAGKAAGKKPPKKGGKPVPPKPKSKGATPSVALKSGASSRLKGMKG